MNSRTHVIALLVVASLLSIMSPPPAFGGDSYRMLVTKARLDSLAKALECYFDEYGVYPPVDSTERYEYEWAPGQTPWFRTFLIQHNDPGITDADSSNCFWTDRGEGCGITAEPHKPGELGYTGHAAYPTAWHLHYVYGLFAHLDYRQRSNQNHWYDADTASDEAAKDKWAHYLQGLVSSAGYEAHDVSAVVGTLCIFTNRVDMFRDGFGGEIKFESYEPWTRYELWADTPEGRVTVYSRPQPNPSNLMAVAEYELDEIERAIQWHRAKWSLYWRTDEFFRYFDRWTPFESQDPDPWGNNYRYVAFGSLSYRLWSAGPDGMDGTKDDILPPGTQRFRESVNARQVVLKALTNAIADVDADLGSLPAPTWTAFASTGSLLGANQLLDEESWRHVPGALWSDTCLAPTCWIEAKCKDGSSCRYAYVVVDCSGFPDAHHVGGTARNRGLGPDEFSLDALPSIRDVDVFRQLRSDHTRYETLGELATLQGGQGLFTSNPPGTLVTYSHFPAGYLAGGTANTEIVSLQGDAATLRAGSTRICAGLHASGLSSLEAALACANLIDYVDADRIPGNADGTTAPHIDAPCVEAIPMFNEVAIRVQLMVTTNQTLGKYQCAGAYWLQFECTYPFVYPDPTNGYQFTDISAVISNVAWASDWDFTPTVPSPNPIQPPDQNLDILPGNHYWTYLPSPAGFPSRSLPDGPDMPDDLTLVAKVTAQVRDPGGTVVDGPASNMPVVIQLTIPGFRDKVVNWPNYPQALVINTNVTAECIDPRMNWLGDPAYGQWALTNPATIGTVNSAANTVLSNTISDGDIWMYVKDAPLQSVGELGAIFYGKPWQTIRLYDHGTNATRHTVMDRFCMATNPPASRSGLVNPNGKESLVLTAAFSNMPLREYRSGSGATRLTSASDMSDVAAAIMAGGPYTNISDLGSVDWDQVASDLSLVPTDPPLCELDKEAFLRNTAGMLGTRQNLFVILLAGGPTRINQGITATTHNFLALQRAVAVVWRDPFPNAQGGHDTEVLFFKWLTREENCSGGIDVADKLAGELSEATADNLLPCDMSDGAAAISFVSLSAPTHTSSNRAARKISYYLAGDCVRREEWRAYTNASYPTYSPYSSDCLASNVVTFRILTPDGLTYTTNLPEWVGIEMEIQDEARVTRRVPLWSDLFGNCSWASNDFEYAFVQRFEDQLGNTFSNTVTWLPIGTVTQTVTAPSDLTIGGTNCSFWHWVVDGEEMRVFPWDPGFNPVANIRMDTYHVAVAHYPLPPEKLVVSSGAPYPYEHPPKGTNEYLTGTQVDCSLRRTVASSGPRTRHVYTDWTGSGSVPPSGTGTTVTITITNDSSITWNWETQYFFSVSAGFGGSVLGDPTGWYPLGETMTVTGVPNVYHSWLRWTGSVDTTANPLTLTNNSVLSVSATFEEHLATNDTPKWWLAQFGWTTNFDSAAMDDQDGDGMPTWQEYHADTVPTQDSSVLAVTAIYRTNGDVRVEWKGGVAARQYVDRKPDLLPTSGLWRAIYTNRASTPITNSVTDTNATNGPFFYRIRAHRR